MNTALLITFWRQRLGSPIRLALLGVITGMPLLGVAFMRAGLSTLGDSLGIVMVLGAGMIGQDVSSGVLTLLFARPVRRDEYVFNRWLAVGIAASAIALLQLVAAVTLMTLRGTMPPVPDIAWFLLGRIADSFGLAAVLVLLSSLMPGVADLALYLLLMLSTGVMQMIGGFGHWTWLSRAGSEIGSSLHPVVDVARIVQTSPMAWYPLVAYASTVTLCLALAIVLLNRKELSYASG
jgi:ABC-type transport system involved in multi-copper enzyme maturation permease subunit